MSSRVAEAPSEEAGMLATIREYDEHRDKEAVEMLDRQCEFGSNGKPSISTDLMGDPIARVRHYPSFIVLVAEIGKEIVGVVSGCLKTVTRGKKLKLPSYVKVAYFLGLRVSPAHRRQGLATRLVGELEDWCRQRGAKYAYLATDSTNEASINLFTLKCNYAKLRTPAVLVNPVHAHYKRVDSGVKIVQLAPQLAEFFYRRVFANSEFFPKDIGTVFSSKLNLGTFMAFPAKTSTWDPHISGDGSGAGRLPSSYAILSIWNTKEVFKLQVKGVSGLSYAYCVGSRVLDTWMPWLRIPSIPDVFRPFGVYFLYGMHMEGSGAPRLMKSLCAFAHNMARDDVGCGAVVAEVERGDSMKVEGVPHWRRFSWTDVWCMKKLPKPTNVEEGSGMSCGITKNGDDDDDDNWVESRPSQALFFTDPRDF